MTTTDADRVVQGLHARLASSHPAALSDIDRHLVAAFERLMLGRPELTDGRLIVTNICVEAGVSRASSYRSPVAAAVKEALDAPQVPRPEIEELRAQVKQLKAADRTLRTDHAAQIRECRDTIATYANQIQTLALRNAELEAELQRLVHASNQERGSNVRPLPSRSG
jgi:plasmid stabilization system protein ParE